MPQLPILIGVKIQHILDLYAMHMNFYSLGSLMELKILMVLQIQRVHYGQLVHVNLDGV